MKTITKKFEIYNLDELEQSAKKRAISDIEEREASDFTPEYVIEEWNEKLIKLGYLNPKIAYSGFNSQGSGASFTATVDLATWLKAHTLGNTYRKLLNVSEEVELKVMRFNSSGNYVHEYSTTTEVIGYLGTEEVDEQTDSIVKLIDDEIVTLNKELYRDIEADYDHCTSEQSAIELIETNDYIYLKDGTIFA